MLMPKRTKHRKQFRGSMAGKATRGNTISNGEYVKRTGKVWIKIFPDKPYTSKPIGVRMGKGKGNVEGWVAVVKPGRVMFEIAGVPEETAKEALRLATHKLPIKCKIVSKADLEGGAGSEN